jgi:hypothetical protein
VGGFLACPINIIGGNTMKKKDETGNIYGRLTVIEEAGQDSRKQFLWLCECECGNTKVVNGYKLRSGHTKSCGCLMRERASEYYKVFNKTHGLTGHYLYGTHNTMKQRCGDPNATNFKNYGGRGIKVCNRWLGTDGFPNFLADMGERPNGMTLDRIDVNGNYEPSNTRWADVETQQNNKRNSK